MVASCGRTAAVTPTKRAGPQVQRRGKLQVLAAATMQRAMEKAMAGSWVATRAGGAYIGPKHVCWVAGGGNFIYADEGRRCGRRGRHSVGGESQNTERESLTQSQHSFVAKVQSQHCVACEHQRRSSQFYTRLVGCLHPCIYIHLLREENTAEE